MDYAFGRVGLITYLFLYENSLIMIDRWTRTDKNNNRIVITYRFHVLK